MAKEENILEFKGKVEMLLPNAMFRVSLENGHTVTCVAAGTLRKDRISVLQGDAATVEVSAYNVKRGRLIFRGSR